MEPDSDAHLVRYLLGDVSDSETERLDERSITDEAFALRLRLLENDLVDRYTRGEPADASLERFGRMHRASPYLREKVRFAEALHAMAARSDADRPPVRVVTTPGRFVWPSLAAAAVLVLAMAGYLGMRNLELRDELGQLEARQAAVERQNAQLQEALGAVRAAPPPQRSPEPLTATFLLPPPRRGLGNDMTILSVPPGTGRLALRLQVESDEHAIFWASVRDPATTRTVWRSPDLAAETSGSDRIVTLTIPAGSLLGQRYTVELSAVAGSGSTELIAHYPVRVVLQ